MNRTLLGVLDMILQIPLRDIIASPAHSLIYFNSSISSTYGHRQQKTAHPVRSAKHKLLIGRLVVGSVTTSESLLLYVFAMFLEQKLSARFILFGKWLPKTILCEEDIRK